MIVRVETRDQGTTSRRTQSNGGVRIGKTSPRSCQRINSRRAANFSAIASNSVKTVLVRQQKTMLGCCSVMNGSLQLYNN